MRATQVLINVDNLKENYQTIKKKSGKKVLAVVKANAYGHGMVKTAKILQDMGVDYLGVAYASEGKVLRENGIFKPILVLVPSTKDDYEDILEYNLDYAISNIDVTAFYEEQLKKSNKKINAHIFVNTGMNRDGLSPIDALNFIRKHSSYESPIKVIGAMTHFATSDFEDREFANKQLSIFEEFINKCKNEGILFDYIHSANSGAIYNLVDNISNMVRPGISLHGYLPRKELLKEENLIPTMKLRSEIVHIQYVHPGDTVGYSMKYTAKKSCKIGIIPIGYGDGYSVLFTNNSECLINGKRHNLVGSVCMDQCMVDLSDENVKVGDEVVFLGEQNEEKIDVYELTDKINVIPYEILTSILERVPRVYL